MNTILGYTVDKWFNRHDGTYLNAHRANSEFQINHNLLMEIENNFDYYMDTEF